MIDQGWVCVSVSVFCSVSTCFEVIAWVVFFCRLDLPSYLHLEREPAADGFAGEEWS